MGSVTRINSFSAFGRRVGMNGYAENACVEEAIRDSGVLEKYPEISLKNNRVGIFGELVCLHTPLKAHDRVEIYRPLKLDPMQARRMRAKM